MTFLWLLKQVLVASGRAATWKDRDHPESRYLVGLCNQVSPIVIHESTYVRRLQRKTIITLNCVKRLNIFGYSISTAGEYTAVSDLYQP